jgi:hypothetical protein
MTRSCAACLSVLVAACISGCSSTGFVSAALKNAALELPIDIPRTRAMGVWQSSEPGHGLGIYVWTDRDAAEYERDLELELAGAAQVCAALALSDRVQKWAYVDLYFFNRYRPGPGAPREVVGVAEVIIRRETLLMLRERNAPAAEYPRHWRFVGGHKDQPDSKVLLSW